MVVWIGYLQWNRANGYTGRQEPILEPLENIVLHDALMNEDGSEYEWPEAEFVIGNPPFLGDKLMRAQLGSEYVDKLRALFKDSLPGQTDLVTYWFEKARAQIASGRVTRAGLLATSRIRSGRYRVVLDRIKETGDIFHAWSDEPWVLEGAAVRVSLICFDDGRESERHLNGRSVASITSGLTATADLSRAAPLSENKNMAFIGIQKGGEFDIPGDLARSWLDVPNPTGVSNRDVLRPYVNGYDLSRRFRDYWIIDFSQMSEQEAARYVLPFEHVRMKVKPTRLGLRRKNHATYWWQHQELRPGMRAALRPLHRYIATTRHAKHRIFTWLGTSVLPDSALTVIVSEEDYTFGVLQSRIHTAWALALGTTLEDRPRYTPSTCFETFPFPRPTGEQRERIAGSARHLFEVREYLLAQHQGLTVTGLYNELVELRERPDPSARAFALLHAHERLDAAVATAYGWEWPLPDAVTLERLLGLNMRAHTRVYPKPTVG